MSRDTRSQLAATWLAPVAIFAAFSGCRDAFDAEAAIAEIEARYGVAVEYEIGPDFLPEDWRRLSVDWRVEPIDAPELETILRNIPSWLDKYPSTALAANLKGIRLASLFEFDGALYAGTASDSFVYIVGRSPSRAFDEDFLERTFHHELSSVFLYHYLFPIHEWVAANPDGFEYTTSGLDNSELAKHAELDGNPTLYPQGFLAEYGRTTLQNDVNMYAEVAFAEPDRMKKLIETYPAIRAKYRVLESFYLGIDPEFAAWFDRID